MLLRHKTLALGVLILLVTSLVLAPRLFTQPGKQTAKWIHSLNGRPHASCLNKSLDWLDGLDITYPIVYARRDIIVNSIPNAKRASLSRIREELFPKLQSIDLHQTEIHLQECKKPFILDVPLAGPNASDASHVMFGVSTTLERLDASIPQLLRWLPNTNARLFAIVIGKEQSDETRAVAANAEKKKELQARMRGLGMDVTLVEPLRLQDIFSEKYFSLIKIMYDNRNDKTQFVSTIDDDTFFPSMSLLVSMLSKYDPREMHYIGSVSEEWWAVAHYGLMGFGGAGIFISLPLAKVLAENNQRCKEASHAGAGDLRMMECIYEFSDAKLAYERDLHQIDIHGDLSGMFESGRMPLSIHHWKPGAASMDGYDLPVMHQVADVCHDCFLQRWQFDADMILANGFSIARYPKGALQGARMDRVESTWSPIRSVEGSKNRGVEHSFGPTRPKLVLNEDKIQYRLIDSAMVDGGVRQVYHHRGIDGDADTLLELYWTKAGTG